MRIAVFSDTYPPHINGVATSTYNLVTILRKMGNEVLLVITRNDAGKFEYHDNTIRIPGIESKKLYGYRLAVILDNRAFKIVKAFKPEVIHNQQDATVAIFARHCAKKLNVPIVHTYHTQYQDYTYYATKGYFDRVAKGIIRGYSRYLTRKSTEMISPSIKTKEMLRSYGIDTYINHFPTGIDFSYFSKERQDFEKIKEFRHSHGIEDDEFVFLSLGRLAKEKSIDVIIQNYALFLATNPIKKTKLLVVGDGPARPQLELLTHQLGISNKVVFIGAVLPDTVPFYYHCGQCFVSASITETQGLTFMEAMAASCVVLARYDDNLTDVIEDNRNGFFFTSSESFINKANDIISLNKERHDEIVTNAYKIIDVYSIEKFYENAMEVYKRAIKAHW